MRIGSRLALAVALAAGAVGPARGQGTVDSGSDGSDGALAFAANAGVIDLDPAALTPPLDADGDGVFHFTTITIPAGTTVRLRTRVFTREGRPVVWLASGAVQIAGVLDLNGDSGHASNATPVPAWGGAGGWNGGVGGTTLTVPTPGNGPGGGLADLDQGGAGSHAAPGTRSNPSVQSAPGAVYGNLFLRPHTGGSGGGGSRAVGPTSPGSGGGGGGGALLLASSTSIRVDGSVLARGGAGSGTGGGGSGGGVRLVAPVIEGPGSISVIGGPGVTTGGHGFVRLEAQRFPTTPSVLPTSAFTRAAPSPVFLPASAPLLRVVRVAGQPVAASPTGSFAAPDVVIDALGPVTIELETRNVPAGTVLQLTLQAESSAQTSATSSPVQLDAEGVGTATATATFPSGHTRIFVRATWTP